MEKAKNLHHRTRAVRTMVALLALPMAVTTVLASPAAAASISYTGGGSTFNPCTGSGESLTGPSTLSTTKQGDQVNVRVVWTGTTSSGDRFSITGQADRPPSTTSYTIPIEGTFTGPGASFTVRGTATVFVDQNGNPIGANLSWSVSRCDT